jgi:signal transduction histidine kinase
VIDLASVCRTSLVGYVLALAIPLGTMMIGSHVGMPAFVFEHLTVLVVVVMAIAWGMGPAVATALASALGDNIMLKDPAGHPTMTGLRDVFDLVMFVVVAVTVGWLVASARRDRAAAEAAVQRERQARADRARLIAMISHDLATPLSVVRGAVQIARLGGLRSQSDVERAWERVDTASARATWLLRTLTDVHTLESEESRLDVRIVDVCALVRSVGRMMDKLSERHPVVAVLPDEAVLVQCDAERLTRVFENLVTNAIKYSPAGGSIEVSLTRQDGDVFIAVRDSGIGVPTDALPHLFERGYRAPGAVETASGLGLGLSISAEIVERFGGAIEVRGGQPKGTVIIVRLPQARESTMAVH